MYFAGGALVPLAPWFFTQGTAAATLSVALTAAASLVFGGVVARLSNRPTAFGALRQLVIVVAAAGITYGVGNLFGTAVA
jgi:VIT1/CCC1 family predicted Fe2+/Mn2+ transporter